VSVAKPLALCAALIVIALTFSSAYVTAASSGDFSSANSAINSAFVATYNAEKSGGNVTSLIAQLNVAVSLVQKAQYENATNSTLANLDLNNATSIANNVSNEAPSVALAGQSSVNFRNAESITAAVVIVIVAALAYVYGGLVYRRTWLFIYRNHVVKPTNG
jgi:hypothetical protein